MFGCGTKETDTTKYCNDTTFGIPTTISSKTDATGFNPEADSMATTTCCANGQDSGTNDCNKPAKCLVGAVGMGTSKF